MRSKPGYISETAFAYGFAVFVALAATLLRHALTPLLGADQYPFIVGPAAVLLAAYVGGLGPGLDATLLTAFASASLWVDGPGLSNVTFAGALSTALFTLVGIGTSFLCGRLQLARTRVADAARRKDQFLAALSHELRNPLAPLKLSVQMLENEQVRCSATAPMLVESSVRQIDHLVRLVDDLLDVNRITRGEIELKRQRVEARAVLDDAIELVRPALAAREHRLTVHAPSGDVVVSGDHVRLVQAVQNLLTNAIKFTPIGGDIIVEASSTGSQLRIAVSDNGPGIAPGDRQRAFDLYERLGSDRLRAEGGLGVGLWLVRQIATLHGGTVSVENPASGRGSRFVLQLPLQAEPQLLASAT